jgi:hypothetical protein
MIVDLHTHTRASHDGYTEPGELLAACLLRGVGAVAITEHDRGSRVDPTPFRDAGVELVPGCEFTTDRGAHILGLFVAEGLPPGSAPGAVLDFIDRAGGIAVMPHPFKPCSGYLAIHGEDAHARRFSFVEAINGGWRSGESAGKIADFARRNHIRMIASSDSHRASQVALCCTRFPNPPTGGGVRQVLLNARQEDMELLMDRSRLRSRGRRVRGFQRTAPYQAALRAVPLQLRRLGKLLAYRVSADRCAALPDFQVVMPESVEW